MRTTYSQAQILKTKNVVKIVGDYSNILILYELMNFGEKSFNELKRMTSINPVTLSKKLGLLKQQGLVDCRGCGLENRYFATDEAESFRSIISSIETMALNK